MDIVIADIRFRILCADTPVRSDPDRKTYRPFIADATHGSAGDGRIDVNIVLNDFPDIGHLTKIFETGDAWSMSRDGDQYLWINLSAPLGGRPTRVAYFQKSVERATVHCGESFVIELMGEKILANPVSYPLDQLLLMYALAARRGACIHSCAADFNGKGYLFPGRSGAGKSTISRIFQSRDRAVLSDDRIIVRKIRDSFMCFGTPWAGDAEMAENRSLPLHGIFFILHGNEDRAEEIAPKEAFERLMPVTSIPWYDEKVMPDLLSFCEDLVMNVPAYDLHFRPGAEVVDLLEEFASS